MNSEFLNSNTTIINPIDTGFNNKDCLFVADSTKLKTGANEPFNAADWLVFTNAADAKKAVNSGTDLEKFIDGYFLNSKFSKLIIAKLDTTLTAGSLYAETFERLIIDDTTRALFYLCVCDATPATTGEFENIVEYFHTNASMIKKYFVYQEYASTITTTASLPIREWILDNNYTNVSCVVTQQDITQAGVKSLIGNICGYMLASNIGSEINAKELVGITAEYFTITAKTVLQTLECIVYIKDFVVGDAIKSYEKLIDGLPTRRAQYTSQNAIEQALVEQMKLPNIKINYNDEGRRQIQGLCSDALDKIRNEYKFIGDSITENEIKTVLGNSYKTEGFASPYYIYPSKITEGNNNVTGQMSIDILYTYIAGVTKFLLQFTIIQATN